MSLWLSDAEVADATRRKYPAAQARVLEGWKVPYQRRPDGTLQVGRAAMEAAKHPAETTAVPTGWARDRAPVAWEDTALARHQADRRERAEAHAEWLATLPRPDPAIRTAEVQEQKAATVRFHAAKRRTASLKRTPPWANTEAMRAVYREAQRLTRDTGVPHHVDHDIPLQGELVSGLHVHNNLQILTRSENSKKRNRFEIEP